VVESLLPSWGRGEGISLSPSNGEDKTFTTIGDDEAVTIIGNRGHIHLAEGSPSELNLCRSRIIVGPGLAGGGRLIVGATRKLLGIFLFLNLNASRMRKRES